MTETTLDTGCCIVGGGPAGIMLGYLLARAGIDVTVVEKHADFLRDYRGDTVHPSTLEIMHQLGLLEELLQLPHQRAEKLQAEIGGREVTMADFSHLPTRCRFIAFMPQWDFLNFLAAKASVFAGFRLLRSTEADRLLYENGQVSGVAAQTQQGRLHIHAPLVVGTDGRNSVVRQQAALSSRSFGASRDVLWMQINKQADDPQWSMGHRGPKQNFIIIDRGDYWQCGYSIDKGQFPAIQAQGLEHFRQLIASVAPFSAERMQQIAGWQQVDLLVIRIDRLDKWASAGVLCIGDAAHAMSPIGGVGVNLAIQDAVASANILVPALRRGRPTLQQLNKVQQRRQFPVIATQFLQIQMSKRSARRRKDSASGMMKFISRSRWLPRLFGRIIGLGFRREKPRYLHR